MWFDNVGFELNPDDYVLCLSGDYAYTIQQIRKLSQRDEGSFIRYMVSLTCKSTVSTYNVISLKGLGLSPDTIKRETVGQRGYDVFGNAITLGDKVLYLHRMEIFTEIGVVSKLAAKTCIFNIKLNRFNQTSYKKPYGEIISLTALDLDETIIKKETRSF